MKNDHMVYQPGMEVIESRMLDTVLHYRNAFNDSDYTAKEVEAALSKSILEISDLMALLSTAATPFLEKIAQRAKDTTRRHFGNSVCIFTPMYLTLLHI